MRPEHFGWDAGLNQARATWALAGLLLFSGCSRQEVPPLPTEEIVETASASSATTNAVADFAAQLPQVGGPEGYAGSNACRSCHEDQFTSWHRTYHRTMTQIPGSEAIQADFNNVVLTNDSTRFTLTQKSNEFWVRMERVGASPAGPAAPAELDVRVSLVTGSHHMQVFWVPGGDGNTQIGFPFTWLIPEKRWVPRHTTFVRPPDAPHRAEIWNVVCSRCHATGIEPRVDSDARIVDTRAGEMGISCEACHGPGQRHVNARLAEQDRTLAVEAQTLRAEIVHPKKIDPARASEVCGFCHSMKWIDKSETWRRNGFRYRPGDRLEETTPIIRPSRVDSVRGLAEFLQRSPDLLDDFFWPDGMIRVSGREYNGLLESPCYPGGKFSCFSCHSMHESEPDDLLSRNRTGNGACVQCHETFRDEARLVAHTRHGANSPGSECYNCHMPHTTYGVLKAIRSHQISSPRVADELATGRPNACNLCHLDQTLAWTAGRLTEWFGHARPALEKSGDSVAQAPRLALSGDAGQRVLVAWHLSWAPALQASGTNWIAPILGQMLDDPYAAVRCVAERSLKAISNLTPAGYDYVQDPRLRSPALPSVWSAWRAGSPMPAIALAAGLRPILQLDDLAAQRAAFDEWLKVRDDRPLRLRE